MLLVVIKKELRRVFTDRRLVFSSFVLPALSIYILYSLMGNMIGNMSDKMDQHIADIAVFNAPDSFVDYIDDYNQQVKKSENELGQAYDGFKINVSYENLDSGLDVKESQLAKDMKAGDVDVIISFDQAFDESIVNYKVEDHPNINVYYNPGEEYSSNAYSKVEYDLLSGYQNQLLINRFGGLESLSAFTLNLNNEDNTIAKEGKEAGLGMSFMLPMLLNIMLFAGAMGIGIDVIAGEKERGTMATQLLAPIDRTTIALGKVLSLGIVAVISATCTFGAIIASMPSASAFLAAGANVSFDSFGFGIGDYLMLLSIIILQVGIFVGLICLISVLAKSVKEAGTYISPIYMLVMISAFGTVFTSGDVQWYKFMIPVMGNVFAIKEMFTFDLTLIEYSVSAGMSLIIIGVLLKLITMAFNNERTMFNA